MRTATNQTRNELAAALRTTSVSEFSRSYALSKATVSGCVRGKPISIAMENRIRAALRLPQLTGRVVTIDNTQRVIRAAGYGRNRAARIEVSLSDEQITAARSAAREAGISVPELFRRAVFGVDQPSS